MDLHLLPLHWGKTRQGRVTHALPFDSGEAFCGRSSRDPWARFLPGFAPHDRTCKDCARGLRHGEEVFDG